MGVRVSGFGLRDKGWGFPSNWVVRDSAPPLPSPAGVLGLGFGVYISGLWVRAIYSGLGLKVYRPSVAAACSGFGVRVLELGVGVYISELGFRVVRDSAGLGIRDWGFVFLQVGFRCFVFCVLGVRV